MQAIAFQVECSTATPEMGTLLIVAFPIGMKFLNFLKPKPTQPTIDCYGQTSSGLELTQIQLIMEWLFASLLAAGYFGKSHLVWYDDAKGGPNLEHEINKAMRRSEPVFLYRCGLRVQPPPNGYYWRMMAEHPSMRIYQLEVKDDE